MKYRIIILNNTTFNLTTITPKVVQFFASRPDPIQVEISFKTVNIPTALKTYKLAQGFNSQTGQPQLIKYLGLVDTVKDQCRTLVKEGEADCVMFAYDVTASAPSDSAYVNWTHFLPLYADNNNSGTDFIQLVVNKYMIDNGAVELAMKHEQMHAFCYRLNRLGFPVLDEMDVSKNGIAFYNNNSPESLDSNFGFTLANIAPFISKLYPAQGYKYFSQAEVAKWKLKPELWALLDKMRGECGFPFRITSGLRTQAENAALADSVSDSAHLSGLAVDIACMDSTQRFKMVQVALANGVKRTGIGKTFVHLDVDPSKVQNVMWHYY